MSPHLIGELVRVRYQLLWARTRKRDGRIALLAAGCLLFVLGMVLVSAGGLGAALLAVRSGRAEMVAQIVLTSVFVEAVLVTVIIGFGMNTMFSDVELRRYPLSALDRRLTRHLIAIVDPFWFLVLALDAGLAIGLYVLGAATLIAGLFAILLLFVCNYLFARVFGLIVDRLVVRKTGSVVLFITILGFAAAAVRIPQLLKRNPTLGEAAWRVLHYTPPFGAAEGLTGIAIICTWLIALCTALVALERRPTYRQRIETTAISFESTYERVAAWFGAKDAPLVAHWLRFYARNNRLRKNLLMTLPLVPLLTVRGWPGWPHNLFLAALGTFPLATFLGVGRFTVNQFGYVDGGLRRYFLLPVNPAAVLRTGSYASMLVGAPMAALAVIGWVVLTPVPFDARMVFMLTASCITGMLVFQGMGLWSSVMAPHRGKYSQLWGIGDLSLGGFVVFFGFLLACLFTPQAVAHLAPELVLPDHWWIAPVPVLFALIFYSVSLGVTGALLRRRHERLIAVVAGQG